MLYRLFVSGPREQREAFRRAVDASDSILNAHLPMPAAVSQSGISPANSWVEQNWGTCRGDRNPVCEHHTDACGYTIYSFDLGQFHTSPPVGFLRIFAMYPGVRFYFELVPEDEEAEELEALYRGGADGQD